MAKLLSFKKLEYMTLTGPSFWSHNSEDLTGVDSCSSVRGVLRARWHVLLGSKEERIGKNTAIWLHRTFSAFLEGKRITSQEYQMLIGEEKVVFVKMSGDTVLLGRLAQSEGGEEDQNCLFLKLSVNNSVGTLQVGDRGEVQDLRTKTIKLGELRFNTTYKRWKLEQSVSKMELVDSLLRFVQTSLDE